MLYQDQNDETLVMLTLAGEEKAYEALVVRYERAVISSAASVTRNEFMAEDAAQDAFVTAWMKLNTLKEQNKFGAWVCRIAKNCALNMVTRYRSFIPIDVVENQNVGDNDINLAELCARSDDDDELRETISKLPEKIRMIIHLHYFEGLSVAEIADRMRISVGTVKWQLHDGRKQIRKELCAMNEKWNDTLVRKVMKKVEELKLWQIKNDKSGFEVVYRDVLRDVEELPESADKYHALADVLMRGWWWQPGEKNDALFARIKEAAELGKNDEVMEFIVTREDSRVYGGARIDFMREKQIPRLEKAGFVKALAREWFWLGREYFKTGDMDKRNEAYCKVKQILAPSDIYYSLVSVAREMEEKVVSEYKDKNENRYDLIAIADNLKYINGKLRRWKHERLNKGGLYSYDDKINFVFENATVCDGILFEDIPLGESIRGTDGTELTFSSDGETVVTPAGTFVGCQLWTAKKQSDIGIHTYKTYYKDGVGIIRQEHKLYGVTDARVLSAYDIKGGKGLLPLAYGNTWEYADEYSHDFMVSSLKFTVSHADEENVIITSLGCVERIKYDENSWLDMIEQIRNEYCTHSGNQKICDVYGAIERAEALAKTPMEKAHTKAAASVARRILDTDQKFNPECKATGHWNFFARNTVVNKNGAVSFAGNRRWAFEWKHTGADFADEMVMLNNDIYGILQDATNCIWSDEWRIGASPVVEYMLWDSKPIKTQIVCEDAGTITTKAGTFNNCMKLSLNIGGLDQGWSYRGGKKEYYFAEGIGIVRFTMEYCGGAKNGSYELTAYEGAGEGYMPLADGFMRRYEAIGLLDGLIGAVEYTCVESDEGELVLFEDRTGIRELPPPISYYGAIQGEIDEENAWDIKNPKEGHLLHAVNNFKLMIHYLARPTHHARNAKRSIEICKFNMNLMESFGNGTVPDAWTAMYAWTSLVQSAAYFGNKEKEEGYKSLERATEYYEKSYKFAKDDLLDTGNEEVFGGIKLIRGKSSLLLPDGRKEPIAYDYRIDDSYAKRLYQILTQPQGWEWFNSVRNEERFKEYIERARALGENKN